MDSLAIFQVAASAAASACSGVGLILWLVSMGDLNRRAFDKKLLIIGQAVIGGFITIGSIVSCFLAIQLKSGKLTH